MSRFYAAIAAAAACLTVPAQAADLTIQLDAREVARRRVHSQIRLAVQPGPLTLVFPKWIPGEHAPTGPLDSMIGLTIEARGQRLAWARDPLDVYALKVSVPAGVQHLDLSIESALPSSGSGFTSAPTSSEQLAILSWNHFLLLPQGRDAEALSAVATVIAPDGWAVASGLESRLQAGGAHRLEEVSLARLIDSPLQIGAFAKRFELAGAAPRPEIKHTLSIMADSAAALVVSDDFARGYSRLVAEAGALFGSRMYRHYIWLLSLSDHVAHFGLEHHESSDNRREEKALGDPELQKSVAGLLGHEYVHSWNAKYRRPQGMLSPDFQKPMDGSLLWVYEGLTQFWGQVLPSRAGLIPPQDYREAIAASAGNFDVSPGVQWRPMADTAVAAQVLFGSPPAWRSSRRGVDFYEASVFLWLDVDAELRERTQGGASLDTFMKRFYAGPSGAPQVKPYVEQDVYAALAAIAPGNWRQLIRRHLDETGTTALFAGLERSGWKLAYSAAKNTWVETREKQSKSAERQWSIGLRLDKDAAIVDVVEGRAAARAGASPGMTLVGVNSRKFTVELLDAAIAEAQQTRKPIELLVLNGDSYRTLSLEYFDGPRYPHLVRVEQRPDTLSDVLSAKVPPGG